MSTRDPKDGYGIIGVCIRRFGTLSMYFRSAGCIHRFDVMRAYLFPGSNLRDGQAANERLFAARAKSDPVLGRSAKR
jgi:hypothetical protein